MSSEPLRRGPPRPLLGWTASLALAIGLLALGLAHHLARLVERPERRATALSASAAIDPEVTGSIAHGALPEDIESGSGRGHGVPERPGREEIGPAIRSYRIGCGTPIRAVLPDPCRSHERLVVHGP